MLRSIANKSYQNNCISRCSDKETLGFRRGNIATATAKSSIDAETTGSTSAVTVPTTKMSMGSPMTGPPGIANRNLLTPVGLGPDASRWPRHVRSRCRDCARETCCAADQSNHIEQVRVPVQATDRLQRLEAQLQYQCVLKPRPRPAVHARDRNPFYEMRAPPVGVDELKVTETVGGVGNEAPTECVVSAGARSSNRPILYLCSVSQIPVSWASPAASGVVFLISSASRRWEWWIAALYRGRKSTAGSPPRT